MREPREEIQEKMILSKESSRDQGEEVLLSYAMHPVLLQALTEKWLRKYITVLGELPMPLSLLLFAHLMRLFKTKKMSDKV